MAPQFPQLIGSLQAAELARSNWPAWGESRVEHYSLHMRSILALVPIREGALPSGGAEVVAEAEGRALLVGEGANEAAVALAGIATELRAWETPGFSPADWAQRLVPLLLNEAVVLLPASPDGRDLAPRIAAALDRTLLAGAMEIRPDSVSTIRYGGRVLAEHLVSSAVVVTLQPGVRGVEHPHGAVPEVAFITPPEPSAAVLDAQILELLPPDVSTMDLSEAPRILGGGAGLDSAERFDQLALVAGLLEASAGATRVVTDRGWMSHARQIGTTGVVVDPRLYIAFGVSGAVQHTAGLGQPDHIISVNLDEHCPMMSLADLALVADANEVLEILEQRLVSLQDSQRTAPV